MSGSQQKRVHSVGNVLFSWENKPGIPKTASMESNKANSPKLLPPPPVLTESPKFIVHGLPPPPCPFQSPQLSSSSSSSKKVVLEEDPFLKAYMECTKSVKHGESSKRSKWPHKRRFFSMSCNSSCGIREDNLVRMSQPPSTLPSLHERKILDG
ncbi:hypothetical protein QJS10_CPA05g01629 [Acorus calamus]|uniref:Uncharacterized protein n=1 Tax=Acorus calamus TaxID=4465 RepID=A0AAV9EV64_ACOCL|nr:hypothetical protein QJS10_CPA05g01629 [Acorus calamus]